MAETEGRSVLAVYVEGKLERQYNCQTTQRDGKTLFGISTKDEEVCYLGLAPMRRLFERAYDGKEVRIMSFSVKSEEPHSASMKRAL